MKLRIFPRESQLTMAHRHRLLICILEILLLTYLLTYLLTHAHQLPSNNMR